ncbi:MAG: ABC transporter ATP-binding protein [Clostridiales Family XIII bacterium]|jgi:ABC-type nitrate/sulfonate/bicarbonate transport system ATPase subunit|nr:ABC transporter ATP-binding protein [Clostridiales Family XIII bacterium]
MTCFDGAASVGGGREGCQIVPARESKNAAKAAFIEARSVRKSFDGVPVLDGVSMRVSGSETVSILGPSGCGKSTLMNIITGLIPADGGDICFAGRIGYMQQKDMLLPWKTIMANVTLPRIIGGADRREAEAEASPYFEMFGIEGYENKYPRELSGGMRRRASFLSAFLISGDVMLLDEPFGALDSITRGRMQRWLIDVKRKVGVAIMLITHDVEEAILLSDRVYLMSDKPSRVRDEIEVDFFADEKSRRLLSPEFMEYKKRILDSL